MKACVKSVERLLAGSLLIIGGVILGAGCDKEPSEMLEKLERIEQDACSCAGPDISLGLSPRSEPPKCARDAALQLGALGYSLEGKKETERDIARAVDHISRIEGCLSRVMPAEEIPQLRAQLE